MAELCFANNMPDDYEVEEHNQSELILGPFRELRSPTEDGFLKEALQLKDEVIQATWTRGNRCRDPTVYTGLAGTAFMCFRSYQITGDSKDLDLAIEIIDTCAASARNLRHQVTFLCGAAGIYAIGAVLAECKGDESKRDIYLNNFNEVLHGNVLAVGPEQGGFGMPYELLYGRAGFLWAALYINKYLGDQTIEWAVLEPIVEAVLAGGRAGASGMQCPLMYRWHGTRYWGAAHGLAGIMHVLLHCPLSKEDAADVKETLKYMINNRFAHFGNYPSSEGNSRDKLVQWCHGAPGIALALCKAAEVFPSENLFREAAIEAGEVVWKRGLLRKLGLCHGITGNAYTFLSLYRLTKESKYLKRAKAFAGFLHGNGRRLIESGHMHGGDRPYSLFEGLAGTACFWMDITRPDDARFPGFEL
eukprot:TRINITY_DN903_c0_g1_i1.p1 TRINITY_DN903_c0_g1~~TRINITY_DN903_c0_g1_i1.p1  ORF type:complete len:417 (-),score=82.42 TRINITY_DN903_c0_g1_i1:582-1832(-)